MEEKSQFDSFELQLTAQAQDYLRIAAKWCTFLSIVGFIALGFMLLGALAMFAMGSAIDAASQMGGGMNPMAGMFSGTVLGLIYLIAVILCFFPTMYLYKFASKTKQALSNSNTQELTESIENLKSYFKFMGILTIIGIAFYIFIFIFAIAVGISAAAGM